MISGLRLIGVGVLTILLIVSPLGAHAEELDPENLPEPTGAALDASVRELERGKWVKVIDAAASVDALSIDSSVTALVTTATDSDQTTVTISTDLLFAYASAEVSPDGAAAVEAAIVPAPHGATLEVTGHTDATGGDEVNLPLSQARADAVAAVIRAARPDLAVNAKGMGSSEPVADEVNGAGEDDPAGRAANRRVEIRFEG